MGFSIESFLNRIQVYKGYYSPEKFIEKVKKFGRKAGLKTVNAALILYYASMDKNIPMKDRVKILAALGYFILPADLIPDMMPMGFADDIAALTYVIKTVWSNLTPEIFEKSKNKLDEWFGPCNDDEVSLQGLIGKE